MSRTYFFCFFFILALYLAVTLAGFYALSLTEAMPTGAEAAGWVRQAGSDPGKLQFVGTQLSEYLDDQKNTMHAYCVIIIVLGMGGALLFYCMHLQIRKEYRRMLREKQASATHEATQG